MITIRQIAKEAGVSKSTVSRYLNKGYVSEEAATKIKSVIEKYNYTPNEFARNLKSEKSKFIGVVIPRMDSPSMMTMVDGIDRLTREKGYQLLISNTDLKVEREIESITSLIQNKVAGIILFATEITKEHLALQQQMNLPIIFVGQTHPDVYAINHDNFAAGKLLAEKLLSFHHQQITYIGVPERDQSVGKDRKRGVLSTYEEAGISVRVIESTFRTKDNYYLALDLLKHSSSTLYIATTDNMAMGLYRAAHDHKLTIGKDISIAGFGGYSFSEFLTPPLTTIDFHHELVGETAALNLMELIDGKEIDRETIINVSYLERESVRDIL
ncbi:LacI family DNA-binding transcriptional regulator [Jeotgalibaca caeni]|uniref:LacI family DNA-binding transcriptional regulator n=1 Tax=Jeotgalibaca caeni TaxID=3028623 RepID=UPI00237E5BEB|nr:LacI family DNA-binding transcriptional regulator [Jeotgalibaca caeni]MDE1549194.1 LacI family DNA-binding transcriptional regulator [Jeotgalibaca caeni]